MRERKREKNDFRLICYCLSFAINDCESMKYSNHSGFDYGQHQSMDNYFFVLVLVEFFLERSDQFLHHRVTEQARRIHYNDRV